MAIELKNVLFKYGSDGFQVNIEDFKVESGSIACVIGPNGVGKTTLLHLLAGLYKPLQGEITIDGLNYSENAIEIYSKSYFTLDAPAFYSHLNARANLKLHCLYRQIPENRIAEALAKVGLPDDKKKFKKFSTGMKQRLNIAAALLFNPDLIVMDEPFNGLDPGAVMGLKSIFEELNTNYGTTIVVSTHLLKEAESFCTHYCIVKDGKIVENRPIENDFAGLEERYREYFFTKGAMASEF